MIVDTELRAFPDTFKESGTWLLYDSTPDSGDCASSSCCNKSCLGAPCALGPAGHCVWAEGPAFLPREGVGHPSDWGHWRGPPREHFPPAALSRLLLSCYGTSRWAVAGAEELRTPRKNLRRGGTWALRPEADQDIGLRAQTSGALDAPPSSVWREIRAVHLLAGERGRDLLVLRCFFRNCLRIYY